MCFYSVYSAKAPRNEPPVGLPVPPGLKSSARPYNIKSRINKQLTLTGFEALLFNFQTLGQCRIFFSFIRVLLLKSLFLVDEK